MKGNSANCPKTKTKDAFGGLCLMIKSSDQSAFCWIAVYQKLMIALATLSPAIAIVLLNKGE